MDKSKLLIPALLLAAAGMAYAADASKEQAEASIQQAKAAYTRVATTGFAWTETSEMIEAAEKALSSGKLEEAVMLAQQARERSDLAYAQYEANKDADMESSSK